jgi:hypothetical protein
MDKSLKEIIKEVGKEYEMEDDIINEIIKKLQKEFYVKLKHMKNLSIETWKGLGLPINLYYVLNELYQSALAEQQPANQPNPQPQITQSPVQTYQEQVPNPQYQQKIQKNQNEIPNQLRPQIQYQQNKNSNQNNNILNNFINNKNRPNNNTTNNNINANDSLQNIVHNNLSILFTEIDNLDISRKVFKQIYTIISNIAHNPNDEKFRRFNIKKFTSTYKYKSIYTLFSSLGFKNVDEYMYLIGDAKDMSIVNTELNKFIRDNKIAQTSFDPYKGSIASLGGNSEQMKKVAQSEVNFEDLYYQEIQRRNGVIKAAKVDRNPKVFELEKNYSINRIINTINQTEEDMTSNSNEDKMIIKKNLALIKEKENDRFTLKSRMRLEQLMKTPIYVKSDIRLKFPNELILQGSFALYETIGDIYNFIRIYLKNKNDQFNISTTPPLKRYLKMEETIMNEKLYPNLLMYINFENEFSGLEEEKIKGIKQDLHLLDLEEEEEINNFEKKEDKNEIQQNEIIMEDEQEKNN